MKKHHFLLAFHSLVLVAASLLTYNYLHLDGILYNPIITYPTQDLTTQKDVYQAGDMIQGIATFCVRREVEIEADYFLVDTYIRSYPPKIIHVPKGCYSDKVFEMVPIPVEAHAGNYHIEVKYIAHLNPVNTVEWTRKSNDFKVVR